MDQSWTLVQFVEEKTIEAIPTSWIKGDYCHWPPFQTNKLMASIKKCEDVNLTWPTHKIKTFKNATYPLYLTARMKIKQIEETGNSDVNSDKEGKRKIFTKVMSSASSDDDENIFDLPPPPRPPIISSKIKNKPSFSGSREPTTLEPVIDISDNLEKIPESTGQNGISKNCTVMEAIAKTLVEHGSILKDLKSQNHLLRGMLAEILQKMEQSEMQQNKREDPNKNSFFIQHTYLDFPIKTEENFQKLEDTLKDENEFLSALADVKKFGGSNPYDFMKRALSSLADDQILINYSLLGRKGKKPFIKLLLCKLLIRAYNGDAKECEIAIQKFLKRCPERMTSKENKKPY